jgi:hypothetical protein
MEGAACGTDLDCPAPLTCVSSLCGTAQTGASCNSTDPDYHTPCQVGDTCVATQAELSAIEQMGPAADPCNAVGLVCLAASGQSGEAFLCLSPAVEPQQDWSPDGVPFDDTACNPNDATCESYYTGADRAAPVCGPFILGVPDRCMEACTTGDDCDSTTLDCISGQCKPNYCYSNSSNASELSTAQTG